MSNSPILRRGFKSQAEKTAKELRQKLNIHPCGFLDAHLLASYLSIEIYTHQDFFYELQLVKESDASTFVKEWSALTMTTRKGNTIIIHNNTHSLSRQQSNLMHELAHVICSHGQNRPEVDFNIPDYMHYNDAIEEEEAKCLGSIMQLPKPALLWAAKRRMAVTEIARHYTASESMVKFRVNMCGLQSKFGNGKI